MPDLRGKTVRAAEGFTVNHNAAADTRSDCDAHDDFLPFAKTELGGSECETVGVIIDRHEKAGGLLQFFPQGKLFPAGNVRRGVDHTLWLMNETGNANTKGNNSVCLQRLYFVD